MAVPVPDPTEWIGAVDRRTWTHDGTGCEIDGLTWLDMWFTIQARGEPYLDPPADPDDDNAYRWIDLTDDYIQATWVTATRSTFDGSFAPGNASIVLSNKDFQYTVFTDPKVAFAIGQPVRICALNNLVEFRGVIRGITTVDAHGRQNTITLLLGSPLSRAAKTNRIAVSPVGASELSGDRIHRILDSIGWPTSKRVIDPGVETLQATTLEGSALSEMQLVAVSEGGAILEDRDGNVVFYDRDTVEALKTPSSWVFEASGYTSLTPLFTQIPYVSATVTVDEGDIVNDATITAVGGTPQHDDDTDSQDLYGIVTAIREDLLNEDDSWPAELATLLVTERAYPRYRFAVQLGSSEAAVTPAIDIIWKVLSARVGMATRLNQSQDPGVDTVLASISGITHTITPKRVTAPRTDTWTVTVETDPEYL